MLVGACRGVTILRFESVSKDYELGSALQGTRSTVRALIDVSFEVEPEETLGLVGESGSGKSTIARIGTGLVKPTSGGVTLMDHRIDHMSERQLRPARRQIGFVFQDPYASLNPRQRVATILALPFQLEARMSGRDINRSVLHLLERVGLTPPETFARKFPHQLSGGQRQRVAIARAIALRPSLLIADEPVSSLDVSVAGQILNLLRDVQQEMHSSTLFISHDLALVRSMCERVLVLQRGQVAETGPSVDVLRAPAHPYTQQLIASMPQYLSNFGLEQLADRSADVTLDGCLYRDRCPFAFARCVESPPLLSFSPAHLARCWLLDEAAPAQDWMNTRERLAAFEADLEKGEPTGYVAHGT
jgi:oligopeptide/dipeptide ABC transporter ATP-binding protein